MNKLKRLLGLRDLKMSQKFIIVFLFLFILPMFCIGFISYSNYTASIKKSTTEYVMQIFGEMTNKLEGYVLDMKSITLMPYYIPDMQRDLQKKDNNPDKARAMDYYLRLMKRDRRNKSLIYVFDSSGNVYYNMSDNDVRSDIGNLYKEYKTIAEKAEGSPVVLDTQIVKSLKGSERRFLTVIRSIKDTSSFESIGLAIVDMDIDELDSAVKKLEASTQGKMYILGSDDRVIYDSKKQALMKKYTEGAILEYMKGESGNFTIKSKDDTSFYIYFLSRDTGWKFFVSIPTRYMYKDAATTSRIILMVSLVAGGIALIFFIIISFSITRPLRKLAILMKKVQEGDLEVRFHIEGNDEVGIVASSFNHMVTHLQELIEEIYITNLRKKQTELNALQGQINPHFIYNTLETIRMISVLHKVDELSELTLNFGKLLRYSVNDMNELVTIGDELDHLERYIYIQNKRFSNKFAFYVEVENSLKQIKTLKLIFQPIVENSIFHGLEKMEGEGEIRITAETHHDSVVFKIFDNGDGIDLEKLGELNQRLELNYSYLQSKKSIGLMNVNERIKLFFGEKYGISINSQPGNGTEVLVRLPIIG